MSWQSNSWPINVSYPNLLLLIQKQMSYSWLHEPHYLRTASAIRKVKKLQTRTHGHILVIVEWNIMDFLGLSSLISGLRRTDLHRKTLVFLSFQTRGASIFVGRPRKTLKHWRMTTNAAASILASLFSGFGSTKRWSTEVFISRETHHRAQTSMPGLHVMIWMTRASMSRELLAPFCTHWPLLLAGQRHTPRSWPTATWSSQLSFEVLLDSYMDMIIDSSVVILTTCNSNTNTPCSVHDTN